MENKNMSKREFVLKAFQNEEVDRVPVGFWFHFAQGDEFDQGLVNSDIIKKNIEGHQKFYDEFQPDFLKLMSDGFFGYPSEVVKHTKKVEDLKQITSIGKEHPWITGQVALVKELTSRFQDTPSFYNIFSPLTYLSLIVGQNGVTIEDLFKAYGSYFATSNG